MRGPTCLAGGWAPTNPTPLNPLMNQRCPIPLRPGSSSTVLLTVIGLAVLALCGFVINISLDNGVFSTAEIDTVTAHRGPFIFSVTETGEVESARSVEIRCNVKARGGAGATVLEIVPEGAQVAAGDFVVQLDASLLELDLNEQTIRGHTSQAAMIQAENAYTVALIAKTEYLEGTLKESNQTIQNEILLAEEDLRRAKQTLAYSKRLAAKGYLTQIELEADEFAVEKAGGSKEIADTKMWVLQNLTKKKMLTNLESDIESTRASWESAKSSYDLEMSKLEEIREQIASCRIVAPQAGQVKYANERGHRGNGDVIIEAGTQVRQGQVIVRLPDTENMQIEADINEARTKYVKAGMPAKIVIGSISEAPMHGRVLKVNDYPEPGSFFSSNVKEYETKISIDDPNADLKPGLTAEVEITVASLDDVLQLPLQSVLPHGDKFYCMQIAAGTLKLTEVGVGFTNQAAVVIERGLEAGDVVVQNPRHYRDRVEWPKIVSAKPDKTANPNDGKRQPARPPSSEAQDGTKTGGRPGPKRTAESIFKQLDSDGDGRISTTEIEAAPEHRRNRLRQLDGNGDGFIDPAEVKRGLTSPPGGPS